MFSESLRRYLELLNRGSVLPLGATHLPGHDTVNPSGVHWTISQPLQEIWASSRETGKVVTVLAMPRSGCPF